MNFVASSMAHSMLAYANTASVITGSATSKVLNEEDVGYESLFLGRLNMEHGSSNQQKVRHVFAP